MPKWMIITACILAIACGVGLIIFAYLFMALGAFFAPPSSMGASPTILEFSLIGAGAVIILLGLVGLVRTLTSKSS